MCIFTGNRIVCSLKWTATSLAKELCQSSNLSRVEGYVDDVGVQMLASFRFLPFYLLFPHRMPRQGTLMLLWHCGEFASEYAYGRKYLTIAQTSQRWPCLCKRWLEIRNIHKSFSTYLLRRSVNHTVAIILANMNIILANMNIWIRGEFAPK